MDKTEPHVKNSKDFVKDVREIRIVPDEELRSYDVSALFTSVPVDKAFEVITEKLEEDQTLRDRTPLAPDDIIWPLRMCLSCIYVLFQWEYYLHIYGEAIRVASVADCL